MLSHKKAEETRINLKNILFGSWQCYIDHHQNHAFKGRWKGQEIHVYMDTGDGLWRAVVSFFGHILSPWARSPEEATKHLRNDIYRVLSSEKDKLRFVIGEKSADLIDTFRLAFQDKTS